MNVEFHLRVVGTLLLLLAALNLTLPRRFHWREELARLSLLNRQIFIVHSLFIGLIVVMMGMLSLVFTRALLTPTPLSAVVLIGLAIFWTARLIVQWFVYDRALWRGNRMHTVVHYVFTAMWLYFAWTFGWAACTQIAGPAS